MTPSVVPSVVTPPTSAATPDVQPNIVNGVVEQTSPPVAFAQALTQAPAPTPTPAPTPAPTPLLTLDAPPGASSIRTSSEVNAGTNAVTLPPQLSAADIQREQTAKAWDLHERMHFVGGLERTKVLNVTCKRYDDPASYYVWVSRKIWGENRQRTLEYLTTIIENLEDLSRTKVDDQVLEKIMESSAQFLRGISIIHLGYPYDPNVRAATEVMRDRAGIYIAALKLANRATPSFSSSSSFSSSTQSSQLNLDQLAQITQLAQLTQLAQQQQSQLSQLAQPSSQYPPSSIDECRNAQRPFSEIVGYKNPFESVSITQPPPPTAPPPFPFGRQVYATLNDDTSAPPPPNRRIVETATLSVAPTLFNYNEDFPAMSLAPPQRVRKTCSIGNFGTQVAAAAASAASKRASVKTQPPQWDEVE